MSPQAVSYTHLEAARIDGLLDAVMGELGCEAPVVMTGDGAAQVAGLIGHCLLYTSRCV